MKKLILFLLISITGFAQQTNFPYGIKVPNNITSTTATKVNVQESNGVINTIAKSDLVDVIEATSATTLPVTGVIAKIYCTLDNNKIYRWTGVFYQELAVTDISGKENTSNKQNSLAVDGTGQKYLTVDAVNTGLSLKAPLASPTFTGSVVVPNATLSTQAINKGQLDAVNTNVVKLTGVQTIAGTKTFQVNSTGSYSAGIAIRVENNYNYGGNFGYQGTSFSGAQGNMSLTHNGTGGASENLLLQNNGYGHNLVLNTSINSGGPSISSKFNDVENFRVNNLGGVSAQSFIKSGGTSSQLLIADGSTKLISKGTATLVNGTVTVSTVGAVTGSIILVSLNTPVGTLGIAYSAPSASIVNGTSFVINSVSTAGILVATDTSSVNWQIIN